MSEAGLQRAQLGGLVVQSALQVEDKNFCDRIGHVFLFGRPSNGLGE